MYCTGKLSCVRQWLKLGNTSPTVAERELVPADLHLIFCFQKDLLRLA